MEVMQVSDRPAFQTLYSIAGRLLFVESHDLRLRSPIEQLFAGWQLTPVSFPDKPPDIRIKFFRAESLPEIRGALSQFEIADGGQCYTNGAELYLALRGALVHLQEVDPIAVDVSLLEVPGPRDPLLARAASFAVCAALRRYGLFDLHSAGVVEPASGKAVVIVGPSGSGKSTLALQLAQSGWPYLSDDELLLSLAESEVEARGFRSFFAVGDNTVTALGLESLKDQANGDFKTCFEPERVMQTQRQQQAAPGLLLFVRLSGAPTSQLTKLTQAETMARLIKACPWASYDNSIAAANLEVLSALARQANSFDLAAGHDLLAPGCAAASFTGLTR
jgi:hypothetical protein